MQDTHPGYSHTSGQEKKFQFSFMCIKFMHLTKNTLCIDFNVIYYLYNVILTDNNDLNTPHIIWYKVV